MRVFITKYALTRGIIEAEATICQTCPDMVNTYLGYIHRPHWFEDLPTAETRVTTILYKQKKKLEEALANFPELEKEALTVHNYEKKD